MKPFASEGATTMWLPPLLLVHPLVSLSLCGVPFAWSHDPSHEEIHRASTALELLQAEVLDTVSLDRAVHFTTPDGTDTVASPETYQVLAAGQDRLKLVAVKGTRTLIVDALATHHDEVIATPIALYVQDDEKFPHVVLLLPGGTGLEAVGSYDVIRSRGVRNFQLSLVAIQKALKKRLQMKGN